VGVSERVGVPERVPSGGSASGRSGGGSNGRLKILHPSPSKSPADASAAAPHLAQESGAVVPPAAHSTAPHELPHGAGNPGAGAAKSVPTAATTAAPAAAAPRAGAAPAAAVAPEAGVVVMEGWLSKEAGTSLLGGARKRWCEAVRGELRYSSKKGDTAATRIPLSPACKLLVDSARGGGQVLVVETSGRKYKFRHPSGNKVENQTELFKWLQALTACQSVPAPPFPLDSASSPSKSSGASPQD
ncbi:hypothetical protein T484DRAFT_1782316, partial [Baffinella frigidus]